MPPVEVNLLGLALAVFLTTAAVGCAAYWLGWAERGRADAAQRERDWRERHWRGEL